MISTRLIRRISHWWLHRCAERKLSTIPGYRKINAELAERRRKHRPTRDLMERKRQLVHDNMKGLA
jgi:hypothetical protein